MDNIKRKSKKGSKKSKGSIKSKKVKSQKAGYGPRYNPIMQKSATEDTKCAPSKKFSEGSCFTLETLVDMANAYNTYIDLGKLKEKKITITDSKKEIVSQLTNRLKDVCEDQLCWLKQDFLKLAKNQEDIRDNTFRPTGPQGRFTWLSTSNINKVINQYEAKYPEFKYLGTVPMDFDELPVLGIANLDLNGLYNDGKYKLGIIFNLDEHYKGGSHWVALYANIKTFEIYYFDSYGTPPVDRVRNLVARIVKWCLKKHLNKEMKPDGPFMQQAIKIGKNEYIEVKNNIEKLSGVKITYSMPRQQYKNSECGVYSMNFILRLLKGETFEEITNTELPDDKVNKCREVYFRFDEPDNDD